MFSMFQTIRKDVVHLSCFLDFCVNPWITISRLKVIFLFIGVKGRPYSDVYYHAPRALYFCTELYDSNQSKCHCSSGTIKCTDGQPEEYGMWSSYEKQEAALTSDHDGKVIMVHAVIHWEISYCKLKAPEEEWEMCSKMMLTVIRFELKMLCKEFSKAAMWRKELFNSYWV